MIVARIKTSSKQATTMVPYKVDTGSDGNKIPFNIFKKLFPSTTEDTLVVTKDTTMLRTFSTTITQLGRCGVIIENVNKHKKYIFCVVPGDGDALLGMLDFEPLNILQLNFNTIDTKIEEKGANYNQNKKNTINVGSEQCCTDTGLEKDCGKKGNDADSSIHIGNWSNSNNRPLKASLPMVNDNTADYLLLVTIEKNNEIEYLLPGKRKVDEKTEIANIIRQIQKEFEAVLHTCVLQKLFKEELEKLQRHHSTIRHG